MPVTVEKDIRKKKHVAMSYNLYHGRSRFFFFFFGMGGVGGSANGRSFYIKTKKNDRKTLRTRTKTENLIRKNKRNMRKFDNRCTAEKKAKGRHEKFLWKFEKYFIFGLDSRPEDLIFEKKKEIFANPLHSTIFRATFFFSYL